MNHDTNLQSVSNQFPRIAHIQQQVEGILGGQITGFSWEKLGKTSAFVPKDIARSTKMSLE